MGDSQAFLVLIETSGNQRYIFATNKLREQVGASELIYRVGTQWLLGAVAKAGGPAITGTGPHDIRESLCSSSVNPPLESGATIEIVLAASGKALLLTRDRDTARQIVYEVTARALREAPGLDVTGVVSEPFDLAATNIHQEIRKIHELHTAARSMRPGPEARFQRLPVVAECQTSGAPARRPLTPKDRVPPDDYGRLASHEALAKTRARDDWQRRVERMLNPHNLRVAQDIDDIEEVAPWIAVVHADGNGLGQVFLNFDRAIPDEPDVAKRNRSYIDTLRKFSLELDRCSEQAFCETLKQLAPDVKEATGSNTIPIVPLILGGDDLTAICAGGLGLEFAVTYGRTFARIANNERVIADSVRRVQQALNPQDNPRGLTSSVGVAIVKPHYPFHAAYDLAEALLRSAKKLKPDPGIDFQIVYDASACRLEQARAKWLVDDGRTVLTARPYLIASENGTARGLTWDELSKLVAKVEERDPDTGTLRLPRSQLHRLREALFEGREAAEATLKLIRHRYGDALRGILLNNSLFFANESDESEQRSRTHVMDLLEVAGIRRDGWRR